MRKPLSSACWFAWMILSAAALAAGCQNTNVKGKVGTTSAVQVTPMEYAAMTPEARAKGNFVVVDDHALPSQGPKTSAVIFQNHPDDKIKTSKEVSYEDLNKSRTP